jgi:hypothetical protein
VLNAVRRIGRTSVTTRDVLDERVGECDLAGDSALLLAAYAGQCPSHDRRYVGCEDLVRFLVVQRCALHEIDVDRRQSPCQTVRDQRFIQSGYDVSHPRTI